MFLFKKKHSLVEELTDLFANNEAKDFYVWLDDTKPTTERWQSTKTIEEFKQLMSVYIIARTVNPDSDKIDIIFSINKDCKEEFMECLSLLDESKIVDGNFFFTLHNKNSKEDSISDYIKSKNWNLF